ncbi:ubiquitin carboxyl-terminal hydrolase MINDY-2 isoform X2 [Brachyhypopomus gauderio]|uniref:ubiquitin carboxyl-terminal hydrolase MINDY-2 isoform X2 n=1 Tax=Brachyhypopomus gauderio TaxID=698409 RepID=UPI0040431440
METNANLHRDVGGSSPCTAVPGEAGDTRAAGGARIAADVCNKREASLGTSGSCTSSASRTQSASANANAISISCANRSDVCEMIQESESMRADTVPSGADQLSNGTGYGGSAAGNNGGGASKLVNNPTREEEPAVVASHLHTDTMDPVVPSKPTRLCSDAPTASASSGNAPRPEGPPSGSEHSAAGESRSLDSPESFSNLNSCPSSDLNSEGLEDKGLASVLQGECEADGAKLPCGKDRGAGQSIYHIKWIKWKEEKTPIITQNENGPCPLLAIMNVLLLVWKVKLPPMMEIITAEQLMEYLGDYILDAKPKEISEAQRLNYEQNMSDAMAVLHKLQTGLDVNVKFTGVRVFEYTPECIVFDLLDIPLYHGWLVDPQMVDIVKAVGHCSYNQLVEKIISYKQSENSEMAGEGFVAEQFLNSTATQLTYHGLCELTSTVQEGELCVFFRNNHFSTMTKFKGQLYLLVTDQGFLTEEKVVWESLHNVDGDGNFCDSEFRLRPPSDPETVYHGQQDQIDQDYLMALSLQQEQQSSELGWEQLPEGISDLELAKKLQEEEDRRASQFYQEQEEEQAQAAAQAQGQQQAAGGAQADGAVAGGAVPGAATSSPGKQPSAGERKVKKEAKDKDKCVLL